VPAAESTPGRLDRPVDDDAPRAAGAALDALAEVMATLRSACPWDRRQTHGSLRRHLLEECHEALEALDRIASPDASGGDAAHFADLCEELGDVLFQVVFHAHLAAEESRFDLADVIDGVRTKLVARHPAIFTDDAASDAGEALHTEARGAAWERAKVAEKARASVMDGMPPTLPALAYASKVVTKAHAVAPALVAPVSSTTGPPTDEAALGRELLAIVQTARAAELDPEVALRTAARALEEAVRGAERRTDPGG